MLFTGTGKYSGGLWECSMIGVEDRRPIQLHHPSTVFIEFCQFQSNNEPLVQWLILVPLKGGRWHIIPQLAVYTTFIPLLLYCLLGDYMLPTTF